MENIRLVGVQHHIQGDTTKDARLMNETSEYLFVRDILPAITDDSIIFVEGWKGKCSYGAPAYEEQLVNISQTLAKSGKWPIITGVDPRYGKLDHMQKIMDAIGMTFEFSNKWITLDVHPRSVDEMLEIFRRGNIPHRLRLIPGNAIKKAASNVIKFNEQFSKDYIAHMKEASKQHDACFLITGAAHCIDIHIKTGLPLNLLYIPNRDAPLDEFFKGYLNGHVFPRTIRGW